MNDKTLYPTIGMEVHLELATNSKMFCGCKNDPFFAEKPNVYTCPVCLGMPGGLPVANRQAIDWTILLGLALGSEIASHSKFDRKHYMYPDLAKGYQISQYDEPLCVKGVVKTSFGDVQLERIHLEEDTGKLQHTTINGKKKTLIDFNRSGVPLVEIVTKPDIHSAVQAKEYAKTVRETIRALGISTADMEKGSMRLEANISLSFSPDVLAPYKVEVKNINSFRFLEQAIEFELKRQEALLLEGTTPTQETRGWNEEKNMTVVQRSKENAEDYRYFPDPDLPPMEFDEAYIGKIRNMLPMLPEQRKQLYLAEGVKESYAALMNGVSYNMLNATALIDTAKKEHVSVDAVVGAIINKKISLESLNPADIVSAVKKLSSHEVVSGDELRTTIQDVLAEQTKAVADYKAGKTQVLGFMMGMVMKKLGKKVDPKTIIIELKKRLS